MNNADLVWHLVELLLQKEELKQVALVQDEKSNKSNAQQQNEA